MDTHLECPSCHQLDRVISARAAYENGMASTTRHGTAITVTPDLGLAPTVTQSRSTTMSGLSQRLDPLEEKLGDSFTGTTIAFAVMILIVLAGMWRKPVGARLIVGGLLAVSGAVFIVLLAKSAKRERDVVVPWWKTYMDLWGKPLYCERCDIVYDPADPMKPFTSRRCTTTSFRALEETVSPLGRKMGRKRRTAVTRAGVSFGRAGAWLGFKRLLAVFSWGDKILTRWTTGGGEV